MSPLPSSCRSAGLKAIAAGLSLWFVGATAGAAEQAAPLLPGQAIKGCAIPKEFGKLVTYLPGEDAGIRGQVTSKSANGNVLAGQAIFEGQDGTIRWVAVVAPAGTSGEKPALRMMPRNFPVMPIYDCALANVWERR